MKRPLPATHDLSDDTYADEYTMSPSRRSTLTTNEQPTLLFSTPNDNLPWSPSSDTTATSPSQLKCVTFASPLFEEVEVSIVDIVVEEVSISSGNGEKADEDEEDDGHNERVTTANSREDNHLHYHCMYNHEHGSDMLLSPELDRCHHHRQNLQYSADNREIHEHHELTACDGETDVLKTSVRTLLFDY
jgi:hypothetical protein